eukprot:scaffold1163_cov362-Prasinococcus_capsulatus_cf.AAC.15
MARRLYWKWLREWLRLTRAATVSSNSHSCLATATMRAAWLACGPTRAQAYEAASIATGSPSMLARGKDLLRLRSGQSDLPSSLHLTSSYSATRRVHGARRSHLTALPRPLPFPG